jgi:hypothetical protein
LCRTALLGVLGFVVAGMFDYTYGHSLGLILLGFVALSPLAPTGERGRAFRGGGAADSRPRRHRVSHSYLRATTGSTSSLNTRPADNRFSNFIEEATELKRRVIAAARPLVRRSTTNAGAL